MNFFSRFSGRKNKQIQPPKTKSEQDVSRVNKTASTIEGTNKHTEDQSSLQKEVLKAAEKETSGFTFSEKRSIRVFISSTFRDMIEDRNELMTHSWPELRRFCAERYVDLTEVDLRWGISEEQSTRNETLKLCIDEIRACRPFFIGLLGERYGWIPSEDACTADLIQEQPWLKDIRGKSVTELEILHGVLNNPEMAGRAFFFFRDPEYAKSMGDDFHSENKESEGKQTALKDLIREICLGKGIFLHEDYRNPRELASLVLQLLKTTIKNQFPVEEIPNPLVREALDHEAFAEMRRRTYIGRTDYFRVLDNHCSGDGTPLLLSGDSGSGKSALFANWVESWRKEHLKDFIFQHYIGSTSESSSHWKLMIRLIKEIKQWTGDSANIPKSHDEILRDFPVWLIKANFKSENEGIRFIIILDALNQLDDTDHGHLLNWLPEFPFTGAWLPGFPVNGALRLMVSTQPGEALKAVERRNWQTLRLQLLSTAERRMMIVDYLKRFGKKLDEIQLDRLSKASSSANPLYLKILLDELRVTGTFDKLDERLNDYLEATDIPTLLQKILRRYQKDYERDCPGLVGDALSLIWSARRGLTENELLQLLKPGNLPQLPLAIWAPLRAALEEWLINRCGILNFAHDFICTAIETTFLSEKNILQSFREQLADFFETLAPTIRACDELPWLLMKTGLFERLKKCLLNIDNFLLIIDRDIDELAQYWVDMGDGERIGEHYSESFNFWSINSKLEDTRIVFAANQLGYFLGTQLSIEKEAEVVLRRGLKLAEKCYGPDHPEVATIIGNMGMLFLRTNRLQEAESYMEHVLKIDEKTYGSDHPNTARDLNNLAGLLQEINRLQEAESLMERSLKINEKIYGPDHPEVAAILNNLAALMSLTNRIKEAEPFYERALKIREKSFGSDHPNVALTLNNLALLLHDSNRTIEAESLLKRALKIDEKSFGPDHPDVARDLSNMAQIFQDTNRLKEAEPLMQRALKIDEKNFGPDHTMVAYSLNNLALLLKKMNRFKEAEPLYERALKIDEKVYGPDHPTVAINLNNLAQLMQDTKRFKEAEPLLIRALKIDEKSYGPDHPNVAIRLNNLATLFYSTNLLTKAVPLAKRAVEILVRISVSTRQQHPRLRTAVENYGSLLQELGWSDYQIHNQLIKMGLN